jgi:hypothetical protein
MHRKGPAVADSVTLRSPEGQEIEKAPEAVPFFVNQGYVVLTSDGRVNSKATTTAAAPNQEK